MGLPFSSGHVLGLRRFPASSVGPRYTLCGTGIPRDAGRFILLSRRCRDVTGTSAARSAKSSNALSSSTGRTTELLGNGWRWHAPMGSSASAYAYYTGHERRRRLGPGSPLAADAGALGDGSGGRASSPGGTSWLTGSGPNGQWFVANPRLIWSIPESTAVVHGEELDSVSVLPETSPAGRLLDTAARRLCRRRCFFQSFKPAHHLAVAYRKGTTDPP